MKQDFGNFAPLFGSGAPYLGLLHLMKPPIDLLRSAILVSGDTLAEHIEPLLAHENWRPQLVGISAMLMAKNIESLPALWMAIDRPSWVSPQLTAAASLLDPTFETGARLRLERRCRLEIGSGHEAWTPERHSTLGPNSWFGHSAKLMTSLIALYGQMFPDSEWLAELGNEPDVVELCASDTHDGGGIALEWRLNAQTWLMKS